MSESSYLPPSRLQEQRERVISELSAHFAHDNLDTREFETRLDRAYRASTLEELQQLKADLPALPAAVTGAAPGRTVELAREDEVRNRQLVGALMGGAERKGVWTPARTLDVIAVMGGVGLDFREARLAPGVTEVHALAIMGGIEILVPPGIGVESNGIGIMGGFESYDQAGSDWPDAPVLRITGLALMGGVEIAQRLPGESARDARLRQREERRRLQRGQ